MICLNQESHGRGEQPPRLVGEKAVEFREERFRAWFGESGHREKDARGIIGVLEVRLALVTSSDYVEDIDSEDNG